MEKITVDNVEYSWSGAITEIPQVSITLDVIHKAANLMCEYPNCTVELKQGATVDFSTLENNQTVISGDGKTYCFLLTKREKK